MNGSLFLAIILEKNEEAFCIAACFICEFSLMA
jgi:hypothetical protein